MSTETHTHAGSTGHALHIDGHSSIPHVHKESGAAAIMSPEDTPRDEASLLRSSGLVRGMPSLGRPMHEASTPVIIGVAGASGSGKTSIAELIAARLHGQSVLSISSDNYYISLKPDEDPTEHNFDHPSSIDFDLLADHLEQLRHGKDVDVPHYDFVHHCRTAETTHISGASTAVIILDGILVLWADRVRAQCDMTIFCSEDLDVCLARRLSRDLTQRGRTPESVITQYLKFVKPGYHQFVAPSMTFADLIVPRARDNVVAINMLAREIQRRVETGEVRKVE